MVELTPRRLLLRLNYKTVFIAAVTTITISLLFYVSVSDRVRISKLREQLVASDITGVDPEPKKLQTYLAPASNSSSFPYLAPASNSSSSPYLAPASNSSSSPYLAPASNSASSDRCPPYFAWIKHELATWNESGITEQSIAEAKTKAQYRVIIVDGKLYMERYAKCFATRADFTLWGLLMLLHEYPGMVPDVDMMFTCGDFPQVPRVEYERGKRWPPPPVFAYCSTREEHYDFVFPDWSFWGWPEVNIAPWSVEKEKIFAGARKTRWSKRKPFAYWKGNYRMGPARADLIKCTKNKKHNFSLVTYNQRWRSEVQHNFHTSDLSSQCSHRYKVYVEGRAWSVSLKYIMACGSTVLQIEPVFQEFFARSLLPYVHFWPINRSSICHSIKAAVEFGNAFPKQAEAIGKRGQAFLDRELTLDYVYQYMLHLLQGYNKLLKFKPVVPPGLQPMTLDSSLPGHEITIPKNRTSPRTLCSLPEASEAAVLIARQREGYKKRNPKPLNLKP